MTESKEREYIDDGVAEVVIIVYDQRHLGWRFCGNCNYTLPEKEYLDVCPECAYRFVGTNVCCSSGESDF